MKAFINCKHTKESALILAQQHYEHDQFIQGTYGDAEEYGTTEFKGCSVGCMANGLHGNYPNLFGIFPQIAYLSDAIFEGLNVAESKAWTIQLFNSIKEGSNTQVIFHHFMHWLLVDEGCGVIRFNDCDEIREVAKLHLKATTETVTQEEWDAARAAAWDAAWDAARAAARAAAWAAAWDAAWDAAWAAAWDAAWAAAWDAAWEKHHQLMRDKLIELFSSEVLEAR